MLALAEGLMATVLSGAHASDTLQVTLTAPRSVTVHSACRALVLYLLPRVLENLTRSSLRLLHPGRPRGQPCTTQQAYLSSMNCTVGAQAAVLRDTPSQAPSQLTIIVMALRESACQSR
jgi:hypothetical protein